MKKIIIAIIMALMSISAFGQITDKGKCFEMRVGDYVETSGESCYNFNKESGWCSFGFDFFEKEEAKEFYNFLISNYERIGNKWGIEFDSINLLDAKEYGLPKEYTERHGRYVVSVSVIFPERYKQYKENERKKEMQKKNEMHKRLNSLKEF